MLEAQKVIYSFKTLFSLREINSADVHEGLELALGVIPQECKHGNKTRWRNVKSQFILEDGKLLDKFWQALDKVGTVSMERLCCLCIQ